MKSQLIAITIQKVCVRDEHCDALQWNCRGDEWVRAKYAKIQFQMIQFSNRQQSDAFDATKRTHRRTQYTATATDSAICTPKNRMNYIFTSRQSTSIHSQSLSHTHTHTHIEAHALTTYCRVPSERAHNKLHWSISHFFVQYKKHTSLQLASSARPCTEAN